MKEQLLTTNTQPEAAQPGRATRSARPILVIDDDRGILEAMAGTLEDAGYIVAAVSSGREAWQWIQAADACGENPALILLDLAMPGMNGEQFATALRHRWGQRAAPIVVISADAQAEQRGRALGAACTLKKPFDLDVLLHLAERFGPTDG